MDKLVFQVLVDRWQANAFDVGVVVANSVVEGGRRWASVPEVELVAANEGNTRDDANGSDGDDDDDDDVMSGETVLVAVCGRTAGRIGSLLEAVVVW